MVGLGAPSSSVGCALAQTQQPSFQVERSTIDAFVDEVMDLVELGSLRDSVVGVPGVSGLSVEQRKRLTIAVELVRSRALCCGRLQQSYCGLCLLLSVAALFCNVPFAASSSIQGQRSIQHRRARGQVSIAGGTAAAACHLQMHAIHGHIWRHCG